MSKSFYSFDTKNMGTAEIRVFGEYSDSPSKDISVTVGDLSRDFMELGDGDDVIEWMLENGVEFESDKSMVFNADYISAVMIDEDATEQSILDDFAKIDEDIIEAHAERLKLA